MKKILSLTALALLSTFQMHGMQNRKRVFDSTDMALIPAPTPQELEEEKRLKDLDADTDPNRYGPLTISNPPNHRDADCLVKRIYYLKQYSTYPAARNRIANAIRCGHYHPNFANIVTEKNDLPLWNLLVAHRDRIKRQHDIDVVSTPCGLLRNPPLFNALSVQIASLLMDNAPTSISQKHKKTGENIMHRACYHDRDPALLAYFLTKDIDGVHRIRTDKNGNTLLLTLCKNGFGPTHPKSQYLDNALKKLEILKNAHANFFHRNRDHQSAFDIVMDFITQPQCEERATYRANIATLITFLNRITTMMNEQQNAKITEAKAEDNCAFCWEPLETGTLKMIDCLHVYHDSCILKAIHAGTEYCPVCRAKTMPKNEIPVSSNNNN